ncbi:uncharacterized protein K02A2.6-like [Diabrotica virgifera virgifera]|uniref:RNA-directed DNA polymerase n=1 Tax=Diabrotica virgifera virgifera TaxID=50390 RepID=A0ABM5L3Y5_DIAVI|nr:uncharacterized protein K02A2.6-like [Diabrotica virgifera virgifera]
MLLKLLKYDLTFEYVPGPKMFMADFLSRNFLKNTACEDKTLLEVVHCMSVDSHISDNRLAQIKLETAKDKNLKTFLDWYSVGFPKNNTNIESHELKNLYKLRDNITIQHGILYLGLKVIVPKSLRREMLDIIHTGHYGINKSKNRARSVLYWPGMSNDIVKVVQSCSICEKFNISNSKEPLIPHQVPDLPFNKVGVDLFQFGNKDYLVLVDYYSRWLEIKELRNKTSESVISVLKEIFSLFGIPSVMISDNMPFSSYRLKVFAKEWGINIITSSPMYPKSNGLAEKGVGIAKRLMKKCAENNEDVNLALLAYRNTPITGMNYSPSQMLMSRVLRDKLPCNTKLLKPKLCTNVSKQILASKANSKLSYDQTAISRKKFETGNNVLVQDGRSKLWSPAKIVQPCQVPRSYVIQKSDGRFLRRNTFQLRKSHNDVVVNPKCDVPLLEGIPRPSLPVSNIHNNIAKTVQPSNNETGSPPTNKFGRTIRKPAYLKDYCT